MFNIPGADRRVFVCDPVKIAREIFPRGEWNFFRFNSGFPCLNEYDMAISLAKGRHRQSDVYAMLFGESFANAHDARADVAALERICEHPSFAQRLHTVCRVYENLSRQVKKTKTDTEKANTSADNQSLSLTSKNPKRKSKTSVECARCGDVYSVYFNHKCA
jgi:hypothetical protein